MRTQAFFVALTALTATVPASAQEPITVDATAPTARVSVGDLNLRSSAGQAHLQRRILSAAKSICVDSNVRGVARELMGRACVHHALDSVKPQLERLAANGSSTDLATATIIVSARP